MKKVQTAKGCATTVATKCEESGKAFKTLEVSRN